MSGAVSNASKLMVLWPLNVMSCVTIYMPKKKGFKVAEEMELPPLFSAPGALTWIQAISIPKPPIGPHPILHGLISSIYSGPAILSLALMLQSELQETFL